MRLTPSCALRASRTWSTRGYVRLFPTAEPRRSAGNPCAPARDGARRRHRRLSGARNRVGWGDMRRDDILDISAIAELRGIAEEAERFRFGALTTWDEMRRAPLPPAFAGCQKAARDIGGAQVQNRGTLVGNICTASPAGDGIPCLLSLDAEVELASAARPARRADRASSSTATATPCAARRAGHRDPLSQAAGRRARQFRQARRAALSGDLHRHGRRGARRPTPPVPSPTRASPSAPARR